MQSDLAGGDALDVEQIVDEVREVSDLPPDHLTRLGRGTLLCVHAPQHSDGAADRAERIAQLVREHRQELVLGVAVAHRAVAIAPGFEQLAQVGDDQAQVADTLRRHGRREREIDLDGRPVRGRQSAPPGSVAGAQERREIDSVGFGHEAADVPAKHRLQRLADECRESRVGVQNVAGLREDDGALAHLFHEVAVWLLGAVQRVDLVASRAADDERVDLTFPKRLKRFLGFREAGEEVLPSFGLRRPAVVTRGIVDHVCLPTP